MLSTRYHLFSDFDLSGKRNVLDIFCKLLVEIRKQSIEILRDHADKQTVGLVFRQCYIVFMIRENLF